MVHTSETVRVCNRRAETNNDAAKKTLSPWNNPTIVFNLSDRTTQIVLQIASAKMRTLKAMYMPGALNGP